ncbi:VOC family protein [Streptococcus ictaluri]|uniref:Glyoxalase family protein n=1 Tax=Streptococcus ictaluri 707-05 TaxID=764299 RepID=G5JZB8_9STRE|nr:VOC family protein [Streptococcus ictaluri]EHI70858.1 glyoxalase family protein [Streptococcus ictaluri 707-05]
METIQHIHHITAIIGNVQENLNFYQKVLQLRLVKQTVNFDDPSVYHLYFANQKAEKGSLITFFPWEDRQAGQKVGGQVGRIAFRIPKGSLDFWKNRLTQHQVSIEEGHWFDSPALYFEDKHQLELALVESDDKADDTAILGFHGVILFSQDYQGSRDFMTIYMGLKEIDDNADYIRLRTLGDLAHDILLPKVNFLRGSWGPGTGHHIAWNVTDLDALKAYQADFQKENFHVTVVHDRKYFKSIYLKESGKVIFEFATQGPGMTVDEPLEKLGQALQLPKQLESLRDSITANLLPLTLN